jgi:hypothetical protein
MLMQSVLLLVLPQSMVLLPLLVLLLLTITDQQLLLVVICATHHAVECLQEVCYIAFRHVHLVPLSNALDLKHHTIQLASWTAGAAAVTVLLRSCSSITCCISCFEGSIGSIRSCLCSCDVWLVALAGPLCMWVT